MQLVPGVHKIQPTSASREALDARVNLLTYSEQFDNAAWTKDAVTVTANAGVAPDGTTTADAVVPTATTAIHRVVQNPARQAQVLSVFAKANGLTKFGIKESVTTGDYAAFDLTSVSVLDKTGSATATIAAVGNGWYRCTLTLANSTSAGFTVNALSPSYTSGDTNQSWLGNGTDGLLLSGADVRLATDAAYPYQRVVTATDYADVGVPRSFLHDGFDDSSYTASSLDLSGTDKVTVWAGVYKNSDAASGMLAELTANSFTTNGAFSFVVPDNITASGDFAFYSRGTTLRSANSAATLAPVSRVMTGIGDISGDVATLRLNGVQAATNTGDQGTGNYSNAVLYMGRRNNASLPFNGKVYTIIIRGGVTDAATLALTERYVGSRMGIVL